MNRAGSGRFEQERVYLHGRLMAEGEGLTVRWDTQKLSEAAMNFDLAALLPFPSDFR